MDLADFISETLESISSGIKKANSSEKLFIMYPSYEGGHKGATIAFDVAVTASSKEGAGANAGIQVLGINMLGGKAEFENNSQIVSHIKFDITLSKELK